VIDVHLDFNLQYRRNKAELAKRKTEEIHTLQKFVKSLLIGDVAKQRIYMMRRRTEIKKKKYIKDLKNKMLNANKNK